MLALQQLSDCIDAHAQWLVVRDGMQMQHTSMHLQLIDFQDAERMAIVASLYEAKHIVYRGYEDRGFLGSGTMMQMYWQVISCRTDDILLPESPQVLAWLDARGLPRHSMGQALRVYTGYARSQHRHNVAVSSVRRR